MTLASAAFNPRQQQHALVLQPCRATSRRVRAGRREKETSCALSERGCLDLPVGGLAFNECSNAGAGARRMASR
jgi:hypothetical protein